MSNEEKTEDKKAEAQVGEQPKHTPEDAESKKAKVAKKVAKKKSAKKKGKKVVVARGKRKESVARATISAGNGSVRVNRASVDSISNRYIREIIMEPLHYVGPEATKLSISVSVYGGGSMGQAQAVRTAIAKGIVEYLEDDGLKQKFLDIDRSLLVEDSRRVEPKKYRGPKARARSQKSYR